MENPFSVPYDKLKIILDSYFSWIQRNEQDRAYIDYQKQRDEELKKYLLNKEYLNTAPKEEVIDKIINYSRTLEGPAYIRIGKERVTNQLNMIKRNLFYLIESEDDPFKKVDRVLDGDYRIPIFSKSFWSPIFHVLYKAKLPNWNNKTENFLNKLGINISSTKISATQKYKMLSGAFIYLKELNPELDFYNLNHLMHFGTSVQEGIDLVNRLTKEPRKGKEEVSYWRVILPYDTEDVVIWPTCKNKGLIAIGYPTEPDAAVVKYMRNKMKRGDKIIAYLKNGRIGGVGTIEGDYEDYSDTKPKEKDYFKGTFWRRRKIRWDHLPPKGDFWQIPKPYEKNIPGARLTIFQLNEDNYKKILNMIDIGEEKPKPVEPTFRGFNEETFKLLDSLSKDTSFEAAKAISEEIHQKVTYPLRSLFKDIAQEFDKREILSLEKEKRIISQLFKINPRLGAWPYIWGAFYQKGESRPTSMQFCIWMHKDGLTYGVYPSSNEPIIREKIIENLKMYGKLLDESVDEDFFKHFLFYTDYKEGKGREFFEAKDFNDLIQLYKKYYLNVGKILKPEEVVNAGQNLVNIIRKDFIKLIPLYIFGISQNPQELLETYYGEGTGPEEIEEEPITKESILNEIFLEEEVFDQVISLLELGKKRQIILQGPPGTGKTFVAQKIAKYLAKSDKQIETIQFHSSYSYEDFIEGYRPTEAGSFKLLDGIFKNFCDKAKVSNPEKKFVLIIDEINRGNLSKIFGELLYLLEYRDQEALLSYSRKPFSIPKNLYIIGTMNTADRSLSIMDYALRRRFYFVNLCCKTKRLGMWLKNQGCSLDINDLMDRIERMNKQISDEMQSEDFRIGHSYFMKEDLDSYKLREIVEFEIKPLLQEYFFDKQEKIEEILKTLRIDAS
jgi:5-methylcytosine-specific restriction protein B